MSLILDVIVLLLFAANVYAGYKNGLIRTVLHTCSTLISLVVAYLFSPTLSEYLSTAFISDRVETEISKVMTAFMQNGNETADLQTLFRDAPEVVQEFLSKFGVKLSEVEGQFADAIAGGSQTLQQDLVAFLSGPIVQMISMAAAFFAIFIGSVILLHVACFCLDSVFRLPGLHQINALLGLTLGVVTGLLMAWGVSAAFAALLPALSRLYPDLIRSNIIENTFFVKLLSELGLIPLV